MDKLRKGKITILKGSDINKCPHVIFLPSHYNADGSCKCYDPRATIMEEWGYEWSDADGQWISPEED